MSDNTFKFVVFNWSNINNKPYLSNIDPTIDDYSNLNKIYWIENFDNIYNKNVGNVGIGRAIPEYKLDVDGEINASNFKKNGINISNIFVTSNNLFQLLLII